MLEVQCNNEEATTTPSVRLEGALRCHSADRDFCGKIPRQLGVPVRGLRASPCLPGMYRVRCDNHLFEGLHALLYIRDPGVYIGKRVKCSLIFG